MYGKIREALKQELQDISKSGLYKTERHITSAQKARIKVGKKQVLNMCANNYLGLADNSEIIAAVKTGLDTRGFGMASVRFICGTQDLHQELEQKISQFFGTDDTILYTSCFDANTGLFETLLGDKDAIISDVLNHASIIDGIRLCKAGRYRYAHGDMQALENCLIQASGEKIRMIATDGVFSMDGDYAKLDQICDLAEKYDALVMVDDSHATGFVPPVLWDPPDAALQRCMPSRIAWTSSPLPSARPSAELPVDLPPAAKTLSTCSDNDPDPICFRIRYRRRWWRPR
jgi:glycine C-acetyltransferase